MSTNDTSAPAIPRPQVRRPGGVIQGPSSGEANPQPSIENETGNGRCELGGRLIFGSSRGRIRTFVDGSKVRCPAWLDDPGSSNSTLPKTGPRSRPLAVGPA